MLDQMKVHPAADMFPLIQGAEFDAFKASIAEEGQLYPIELYRGQILDGRNRYRACVELGVEPVFKEYTGNSPYQHVVSLNIRRRQLNESQRAMLALQLLPELEAEAKERKLAAFSNLERSEDGTVKPVQVHAPEQVPTATPAPQARDLAAQAVDVGGQIVSRAKAVAAVRPDLAEKIRAGEMTVSRAYKQIAPKPVVDTSDKDGADANDIELQIMELLMGMDDTQRSKVLHFCQEIAHAIS